MIGHPIRTIIGSVPPPTWYIYGSLRSQVGDNGCSPSYRNRSNAISVMHSVRSSSLGSCAGDKTPDKNGELVDLAAPGSTLIVEQGSACREGPEARLRTQYHMEILRCDS